MNIVNIFAILENSLYSVLFENRQEEEKHELDRLFDFWNDQEQLRNFFIEHEIDLNEDYWEGITIEEAIEKTRKEAIKLEELLLDYAEKGQSERSDVNLSVLFKPLTNDKIEKDFERDKARLKGRKTWLRIYAIRVDTNFFVICGGAIKLRKTLNDREYLMNELIKLETTQKYLKENEDDNLQFFEI